MRVDGDVRNSTPANVPRGTSPLPSGYIAGSKAMESLDRLITSIETFFHPSNTGKWTLSVGLSFL
jgi:proteasome activator subunit 4